MTRRALNSWGTFRPFTVGGVFGEALNFPHRECGVFLFFGGGVCAIGVCGLERADNGVRRVPLRFVFSLTFPLKVFF